jgi:hypothetical protein
MVDMSPVQTGNGYGSIADEEMQERALLYKKKIDNFDIGGMQDHATGCNLTSYSQDAAIRN